MSTVADDLLANLTRCCAEEAAASQVVIDLGEQLEKAKQRHFAARIASAKAEDDIKKRATQNALLTAVSIVSEPGDWNGSSAEGLSIRLDLPGLEDDEVQGLVDGIVGAVCDAVVKRLQTYAEGAKKANPT